MRKGWRVDWPHALAQFWFSSSPVPQAHVRGLIFACCMQEVVESR